MPNTIYGVRWVVRPWWAGQGAKKKGASVDAVAPFFLVPWPAPHMVPQGNNRLINTSIN